MHQYVLLTLRIRLLLRMLRCYWHRDCLLRPWLLRRVQSISWTWLAFKCRKPRELGPVSVRAVCDALRMARGLSLARFALHAAGWYVRGPWATVAYDILGTLYSILGTRYAVLGSGTGDVDDSHSAALPEWE